MTMDEVRAALERNGFRKVGKDSTRLADECWARRYDTPTRCNLNRDKPGIQVCVHLYDWTQYPYRIPQDTSYEMELQGELPNGEWTKIVVGGFDYDVERDLTEVPRLLAMWEAGAAWEKTE